MLLTYRLWRALSAAPDGHPLFDHAVGKQDALPFIRSVRAGFAPVMPLFVLLLMTFTCFALAAGALVQLTILAGASLLIFNGTLYGLVCALNVGSDIAGEREHGKWELLCLLPQGPLSVLLMLARGRLHHERRFHNRYLLQRSVLAAFLALVAIVLVTALLDNRTVLTPTAVILWAYVLVVPVVSLVDFVQSAVLGAVAGMFAGVRAASRLDAQFWAGGSFLIVQVTTYVVVALLGFVIFPPTFTTSAWSAVIRELITLLLRLALFIGIREAGLYLLWRVVLYGTNTPQGAIEDRAMAHS